MLKPFEDRVLVKVIEKEEITNGGIILTGISNKEKTQIVEIIEVGSGTEDIKMKVKKGNRVIISKYSGIEIKYENNDFLMVNQKDILAIID